eukprot:5655_1
MSKRKTTDKSGLNGPRSKRQKLCNGNKGTTKNNNNNSKQTICSSQICNEETDTNHCILNAHCYDNSHCNPSIIEIKKHNISSSECINKNNGFYSSIECDKLCGKINQRLKIYWNEDKQWYFGTIKDFKSSTNQSLIVYDDGESEWLNLTKSGHETVEFLYDNNNKNKNNNNNKNKNKNNNNNKNKNKNNN